MNIIISGNGGPYRCASRGTFILALRLLHVSGHVESIMGRSFSFTVSSPFLSLLAFVIRLFPCTTSGRDFKCFLVYI